MNNIHKRCVKGFVAAILAEDYKYANLFLEQAVQHKIKQKIKAASKQKLFNL